MFSFIPPHLAVRRLFSVNGYCSIKIKTKNKNRSFQPFVSVIVPTYNEVIAKGMENLIVLDYPKDKYEIIVRDSSSTDTTSCRTVSQNTLWE